MYDGTNNDSLKNSVSTITSEDNKLEIVSWQDGGGTIGSYQYIVFWQVGNKIKHKVTSDINFLAFDIEVNNVHHIRRRNGNDLYFCISEGGELNNYGMNIRCLEIDKAGNLNTNIPVFKVGAKVLSNINIRNYNDYSYSNVSSSSKANEIHFGADGKTLYVPIISDKWSKTDDDEKAIYVLHHLVYQFDGTNFVYKKKI